MVVEATTMPATSSGFGEEVVDDGGGHGAVEDDDAANDAFEGEEFAQANSDAEAQEKSEGAQAE